MERPLAIFARLAFGALGVITFSKESLYEIVTRRVSE